MGVGRSRRNQSSSAMSDSDPPPLEPNRAQPGDGEDDDLEGQLSIARLLRHIIRSGQVALVSSDSTTTQDDSDKDSLSDFELEGATTESSSILMGSNTSDCNSKKSCCQIQNNNLQVDISLRTGGARSKDGSVRCCVPKRLKQREYGLNIRDKTTSAFTSGEKCQIGTQFLPNKRRLIDAQRTKTFCCHYTNAGNGLLTASQDHFIRLYEPSGRKQKYELIRKIRAPYVGWSILDVAVSPDGRHCIYGTWADYIHQCRLQEDDPQWSAFNLEPIDSRFCIFSLRFSEDGEEILAGASDGRLYVYNRQVDCRQLKIEAHEDDVNAVCFGDQGSNIIYSGADDGLCRVWDRRTLSEAHPSCVGVLAGHSDGITFIDSKGDGRYLITNAKDQTIKLWDVRKFSTTSAMEATRSAVRKQEWDYRWQSVPKCARKVRRLDGDSSLMTYRGHTVLHTLIRAKFSPAHSTGNKYIYVGCARGSCIVYDVLTGEIVNRLNGHKACVRDVSWHPYENEIISASWDGKTALWRYDERLSRDTNPNTPFSPKPVGDEDTSDDESYASLRRRKRRSDASTEMRRSGRLIRLGALMTRGERSSDDDTLSHGDERRRIDSE